MPWARRVLKPDMAARPCRGVPRLGAAAAACFVLRGGAVKRHAASAYSQPAHEVVDLPTFVDVFGSYPRCAGASADPAGVRDDVAMARLMTQAHPEKTNSWSSGEEVEIGCWKLQAFNTNGKFTSAIFQKRLPNGRPECALTFSGLHATGQDASFLAREMGTPLAHTDVCGYQVYRPIYTYIFDHMHLRNWTGMQTMLADPAQCGTEGVTVAGLSLGGGVAEVVAACSSKGLLSELHGTYKALSGAFGLMGKGWPGMKKEQKDSINVQEEQRKAANAMDGLSVFTVKQLFTFGAPAVSLTPLENSSAPLEQGLPPNKQRCFAGRRFFISEDPVAFVGKVVNNVHPKMAASELFLGAADDGSMTTKNFTCGSRDVTGLQVKVGGKRLDPVQALADTENIRKHGPERYADAIAAMMLGFSSAPSTR